MLATSDKNNDWLSTANDKLVPVGVFGQQDRRFRALNTYHLTAADNMTASFNRNHLQGSWK